MKTRLFAMVFCVLVTVGGFAQSQMYGLLTFTNVWQYDQSGSNDSTGWRGVGYNDSGWQQGAAFFGVYTNTPYPYPVPINTPLTFGGGWITYYFRTHFNFPSNTVGFALVASNYVDDGAVFYLNGKEVGREGMPCGVVGYQTPATNNSPGGPVQVLIFSSGSLVAGDNVLAVEVHQTTATNPDIIFGMNLTAIIETNLTHKILVDTADTYTINQLAANGATNLANYASFSLWSVTASQAPPALLSAPSVTIRYDFDAVPIRGGLQISTQTGQPGIPANLTQVRTNGYGYQFWIVQYAGPIQNAWLSELTNMGVQIVWYTPANAYIVWATSKSLAKLDNLAAQRPYIIGDYAYHPYYRLEASLQQAALSQPSNQMVDVTVQVFNSPSVNQTLTSLQSLGGQIWLQPGSVQQLSSISLQLPAGQLIAVANWSDVYNVEPWTAPTLQDEVQDQIVAGNVVASSGNIVPQLATAPTYTSYRLWLVSKGFSLDPDDYPIVDVVDDGIDNGSPASPAHPDFYRFGVNNAGASRIAYIGNVTSNLLGNGVRGHGNINAGIVAACDNGTLPYSTDANGYNIGMGVSPFGRVAGTKLFSDTGCFDLSGLPSGMQNEIGLVGYSCSHGADLTSNSRGTLNFYPGAPYDASCQNYDSLTRNAANSSAAPFQEMLHIFAAGNDISAHWNILHYEHNNVSRPGTAKNVLTVGATQGVRNDGTFDGCNIPLAASADNVAFFSLCGPTDDGRCKPDIMAPGTHIQGLASQDSGYNGSGVCQQYYPTGQTYYTWSDGTSHSTPAVAGGASLVWECYKTVWNPGQVPSPAMLKALLINSTRYLTGFCANDTLPSDNQGWGDMNLGMAFDGTPRFLVDQSVIFTDNTINPTYIMPLSVYDATKPVRATLVWSDAPGNTTGDAYVNDLDLVVTVGSSTYKGNVFIGQYSTTGGSPDHKNNVENVFLPAGTTGPITVEVRPITIVPGANGFSPGIPGNPNPASQDFALVVYNAVEAATPDADVYICDGYAGRGNGGTDTGSKPDAAVNNMWESPDIWNRRDSAIPSSPPEPSDLDALYQSPVLGQDNWINVYLHNHGPRVNPPQTASGMVKLYWANGSSALRWPTDWNWFADIPVNNLSPYEDRVVNHLWHPPGLGHYCITAIWVSGQDPLGSALVTDHNVNTRNNNNIAWRNMEVAVLQTSQPLPSGFIMRNPDNSGTNASLYNLRLSARLTTNSDTFLD